MPVYAVKTTVNQERAVADLIVSYVEGMRREEHGIKAILVPDELRGYVLIEAERPEVIEQAIQNIPHARGLVRTRRGISSASLSRPAEMRFEEIEHFLTPKPSVAGIEEGSIVEIISGPFKGERARVKKVDIAREEITIELFDAMVPIPITVRGESVRVLSREERKEE